MASVLRWYSGYRLEDFYQKSFMDGGVTRDQLLFLFESGDKERYNDQKFAAAIRGVDLDSEAAKDAGQSSPSATSATSREGSGVMAFGCPGDYDHMTQEEKEEKTRQMMQHWKGFSLVGTPKSSS